MKGATSTTKGMVSLTSVATVTQLLTEDCGCEIKDRERPPHCHTIAVLSVFPQAQYSTSYL